MSNEERQQLLRDAAEEILAPLARLCVAHGLPFAQAEELFKRAFVRAARDARASTGADARRDVSQVSLATGVNRREVTRITAELQPRAVQRPSHATRLFTRWVADKALRGRNGRPKALPRQGPAPSFESLAQSITRHVHPRTLLEELIRLGLAELSVDGTQVRLLQEQFVPRENDKRLFALLGANVGDHLAAAAANVQQGDQRHFEQAVFTDELSDESAAQVRVLAKKQWAALMAAVVPELERLIDADKTHGRAATQRARMGLFSFHEPLEE